jgi:hypothetical protein
VEPLYIEMIEVIKVGGVRRSLVRAARLYNTLLVVSFSIEYNFIIPVR